MFPLLAFTDDSKLHLAAAKAAARRAGHTITTFPPRQAVSRDKIRVAYLSADFHQHATAYLAAGLFETHDRSHFEITALSFGPDRQDAMRCRMVAAFDRFIDARTMSDQAAARALRDAEIDIAVDSKGYTTGHRAGILAYRPAPVQVSWLGYPGTMGTSSIDYILVDETVVPMAAQADYAERLVQLNTCYQINDSRRASGDPGPRASHGLPEDAFVFACFNNSYKISPEIFAAWMRLLQAVPGSVLRLLDDNPWACANLRAETKGKGIDPARLVFAKRIGIAAHLARHAHADLFLDTFPYTAHTTASEALWAGRPLLARMG